MEKYAAVKFKSLCDLCSTHTLPDDGLGQDFPRSQAQALNANVICNHIKFGEPECLTGHVL